MKPHSVDASTLLLCKVAVTCFKRALCDHIFADAVAVGVLDEVFLLHRRSIATLFFDFN